jgi:dCMP deaminase
MTEEMNLNLERVYKHRLDIAQTYADKVSGCTKVAVGALAMQGGAIVSVGANKAIPNACKEIGCLRVQRYGDNSKVHRGPADCRAVHAEIDAIAKSPTALQGATMYITRYPCEACARALVSAGIKRVVYGREQDISHETEAIFRFGEVEVKHIGTWEAEDTTT